MATIRTSILGLFVVLFAAAVLGIFQMKSEMVALNEKLAASIERQGRWETMAMRRFERIEDRLWPP